jgi:hypothetical protein
MKDRRAFTRLFPGDAPWSAARLRPGRDVTLIDLSNGGAQLEAPVPLRPGARVFLQLLGKGSAHRVSGRITRWRVHALDGERGVRYRGAVAFDELLKLPAGALEPDGYSGPEESDETTGHRG